MATKAEVIAYLQALADRERDSGYKKSPATLFL